MISKEFELNLDNSLNKIKEACVAVFDAAGKYKDGENGGAKELLTNAIKSIDEAKTDYKTFEAQLEHSDAAEIFENIEAALEEIQSAEDKSDYERAAFKTEFELLPFLRFLWEAIYFRGLIYPDKQKLEQYYRDEYAEHYRNIYVDRHDVKKHKLTIAVCGYNHLDTTKKCVEQLLARTDFENLDAELILVDHGSTDGTLEYFESLKKYKVVHCRKNMRMNMFELVFQISLSEYFCFVSNDILVTKNWAPILLECMESDNNIVSAMPALPNIANLQTYDVPDTTPREPKEFIRWANNHNRSNPSLWNDRTRLMPAICMHNTSLVNKIGFGDPYYYTMEFQDDDLSLRARRAGYRQILCKDVACYHFGSVTSREAQKKENTLKYGRELFFIKNGVDAWNPGNCYDVFALDLFNENLKIPGNPPFLGIDCGFGDTPLQFRNDMRREQKDSKLYMLTKQKEYMPDLTAIADYAEYTPDLAEGVKNCFTDEKFEAAFIARDISCYEDYPRLFEEISNKMEAGGVLVFMCGNPFYIMNLNAFMNLTLPKNESIYGAADPTEVFNAANKFFSEVQPVPLNQQVSGVENFAKGHFSPDFLNQNLIALLGIEKYYVMCRK